MEALKVVQAFDEAWAKNDLDAIVALYAPDATIESPLIAHLTGKEGVCRGHEEIRAMLQRVIARGVRWGKHEPPVVRGDTIVIEYRRVLPEGEQRDYVDVIEVEQGRIKSLRAYWGWHALRTLSA
jgi:ketosteroid isomerase-like protein